MNAAITKTATAIRRSRRDSTGKIQLITLRVISSVSTRSFYFASSTSSSTDQLYERKNCRKRSRYHGGAIPVDTLGCRSWPLPRTLGADQLRVQIQQLRNCSSQRKVAEPPLQELKTEEEENYQQQQHNGRRTATEEQCGSKSQRISSDDVNQNVGSEGDSASKELSRRWTIPNIITMARMGSCPLLAGLIVAGNFETALSGLALASFSDWLDGFIARRFNQRSVLGGFLDPLADKVLMVHMAASLTYQGLLPGLLGCVLIGRDAVLVGGSLIFRARTKKPEDGFFDVESLDWKVTPSLLSKANTALQFSTVCLCLTQQIYGFPGELALQALFVSTGCATVASGFNYWVDSGLRTNSALLRSIKDKKMLAVQKVQQVQSIPFSARTELMERIERQALMTQHVTKEMKDATIERSERFREQMKERRQKMMRRVRRNERDTDK